MKIFSSFDTNLHNILYENEVERFGADKVIVVHRDSIYLWLKIVTPGIGRLMMLGLLIGAVIAMLQSHNTDPVIIGFLRIAIGSVFTVGIRYVCKKLIDYFMDFAIITPKQIVSYHQEGLFKRSSISLELSNLRSINEEKAGLMKSIFNYGTVVFFSEGDQGGLYNTNQDHRQGVIRLNYIYYPRKLREKILHIIKE